MLDGVVLAPGVELNDDQDLDDDSAWTLHQWRLNAAGSSEGDVLTIARGPPS